MTSIILPISAFILLIIPLFFKVESRMFKWVTLTLGIIVLGFSIWKENNSSEKDSELTASNIKLIAKTDSIRDSLSSNNKAISELGLKIDEKTKKILIIDSQLLKNSIFKIVNNNHNFFYPSPILNNAEISNHEQQRYLTDIQLKKINEIPKDYPISITYNPDRETSTFTTEIKKKLISMGYKIKEINVSTMSANLPEFEVMIISDHSRKTASIDISERGFYSK